MDWLLAEEVGLVAALYAGHPLAQRVRLTRRELRGSRSFTCPRRKRWIPTATRFL